MIKLVQSLTVCAPQNFGVSFSVISVITGIPSLFLFGLVSTLQNKANNLFPDWLKTTGGPAVMVWGWVVVGEGSFLLSQSRSLTRCKTAFFTMLIGLSMAGTFSLRVHEGIPFVTWVSRDM